MIGILETGDAYRRLDVEAHMDCLFPSLHCIRLPNSTNDRHHRGRGVNSTQVRAVDRVLRVHVIVRPLLSHADKFESSIRMQNTHRGSLHMTPLVLVQARASFLNLTR